MALNKKSTENLKTFENITPINPRLRVQNVNTNENVLKFVCPFAMTVSGPSQAGKSEFLFKLVQFREQICTSKFERIIYCQSNSYSPKNQTFFKRLQELFPKLEIHQGLPDLSELRLNLNDTHSLLLLDDLMDEIMNSSSMVQLVSNHCHNFNLSVVFVLQNYYATSRHGKTLIKNCQYRTFFFSRIETQELKTISYQISGSPNFLASNFEFLIKHFPNEKFPYLVIYGHSRSEPKEFMCRSHIFPLVSTNKIEPLIFFPNPNYKK